MQSESDGDEILEDDFITEDQDDTYNIDDDYLTSHHDFMYTETQMDENTIKNREKEFYGEDEEEEKITEPTEDSDSKGMSEKQKTLLKKKLEEKKQRLKNLQNRFENNLISGK